MFLQNNQLQTKSPQNKIRGMDATSSNNMAASGPFQFESPIRNPIKEAETITPESVTPRKLIGVKQKKVKTTILTDSPEERIIEMTGEKKRRKIR
ncbi:hypothetical protein JTB14_015296 [Gonioctena quinquepunctata]|nr:hypothetical protein JTB14_015296 [Gonioctena quinquepunctata]